MNYVYVLQDQSGYVVGATNEIPKAVEICKEKGYTYRMIPFFPDDGTIIKVTAAPIPKEYLPTNIQPLIGDFKHYSYHINNIDHTKIKKDDTI